MPIGVVHRRLDDVGVLNRAIDVGERERLDRVGARDRLVDRDAVLARGAVRQRRLVLVVARRADLLVGGVPGRLRLLNRGERRVSPPRECARIVFGLRAGESGDDEQQRRAAERILHGRFRFYNLALRRRS